MELFHCTLLALTNFIMISVIQGDNHSKCVNYFKMCLNDGNIMEAKKVGSNLEKSTACKR